MEGLITKILSDKCYVKTQEEVVICDLRGRIRTQKLLPLVGDKVIFDKEKKVIEKILPRRNELRRPSVSNITQGLIIASLKKPDLDTNLIDKILVELEFNSIKPIICFTKKDLLNKEELESVNNVINYYKKIYPVYFNDETDKLKKIFKNEITVFIGQTGAGKSTLLNRLDASLELATGEISDALGRGKHTTRHVEIIEILDGMLLDTPGFSALEFPNMMQNEIRDAFIEFGEFPCPYRDCMHIKENDCNVKKAVSEGKIAEFRYQNYLDLVKTGNIDEYKRR
jgi:ribosome biogenesis GTPase